MVLSLLAILLFVAAILLTRFSNKINFNTGLIEILSYLIASTLVALLIFVGIKQQREATYIEKNYSKVVDMIKSNPNSLFVIDEVSVINNIIETNNSLKDDLLIGMWYSEDISTYSPLVLKIKIEGVNNDSIQ